MTKLNAINLLLEPEEFLTAEKESAVCLAAAEDGQGESISKVDFEDGGRSKGAQLTTYLPKHLAEWLQGLFKGDKNKKERISKYANDVSLKNIVAVKCVINFNLYLKSKPQ